MVSIHGLTILMRVRRPSMAADQRPAAAAQQQDAHPQEGPAHAHSSSNPVATGSDLLTRDQSAASAAAAIRERTGSASTLPYPDLADKVLEIITVKDIEPEQVSEVLRMSYEHNLPNRDIGRRLDLRHHTVGKILDASAQVLRDEPLAKVS